MQSHGDTSVTNCIIWGNSSNACSGGVCPEESQIDISTIGSGTVSYCCIENLDSFTGNNNIDDDPDFGGASGGNFRLRDGSAAIDAASTSTMSAYKDWWDFDHDGDYGPTGEAMPDLDLGDRVLNGGTGSIVDMGAYEHVAGCDGDTNGDQVVDVQDLLAILENWDCTTCPDEDLDGSGTVGVGDLLEVLGNWGACGAADAASPPESVLDCLDKYSGEPENQAACIEAMILTGSP